MIKTSTKMIGLTLVLILLAMGLLFFNHFIRNYQGTDRLRTDEEALLQGKIMFLTSCAKCHGNFGEGSLEGPNLIDDQWVRLSGTEKEIYMTIKNGIPNTTMLGWKTKMRDEDIQLLARFVYLQSQAKK